MSGDDKKYDEVYAKEKFNEFLNQFYDNTEILWTDNINDPPDYFLKICNKRFGVEVMGLVQSDIIIGNREYSSIELDMYLTNFCKKLEEIAINKGLLNGSYILHLNPISNLGQKKEEILEKALIYVSNTSSKDYALPEILIKEKSNRIEIEKIGNSIDILSYTYSLGMAKWEDEITSTSNKLLYDAVNRKNKLMKEIKSNKILLLLDRYHFAKRSHWENAIKSIVKHNFHTVALIWNNGETLILESKYKKWFR